jgi:hypothetical protein
MYYAALSMLLIDDIPLIIASHCSQVSWSFPTWQRPDVGCPFASAADGWRFAMLTRQYARSGEHTHSLHKHYFQVQMRRKSQELLAGMINALVTSLASPADLAQQLLKYGCTSMSTLRAYVFSGREMCCRRARSCLTLAPCMRVRTRQRHCKRCMPWAVCEACGQRTARSDITIALLLCFRCSNEMY